jgi:phospholipid transport system substrate-binding protein
MKRLTTALLVLALTPLAGRAADADTGAVKKFVRSNVEKVLEILKDEKLEKDARKDEVISIADSMFDLPLMAKLSLGRKHWPKFKKEERSKFTDLFVTTLKASYADKIDLITDETVEFETPVRKSKTKFEMTTNVVSKDQRYKMIYKITKRGGAWKIYDVEIEGISIVRSYGSQYDQFLADHSTKELLEKMEKKAFAQPKDLQEKADEIKRESAKKKGGAKTE